MLVQAFVAEPPVEALHEPVLLRLAGRDGVPQHAILLLPVRDRVRRQLGAVAADDHCGSAAEFRDLVGLAPNPQTREGRVDHQGEALAGVVVDDRQHSEPAPVVVRRQGKSIGALPHVDCYRPASLPQVVCYQQTQAREATDGTADQHVATD